MSAIAIPRHYHVTAPVIPAEDRSGAVGVRLLRLMGIQARRNLQWVEDIRRQSGHPDRPFVMPSGAGVWPLHVLYQAATSGTLLAILARFDHGSIAVPGVPVQQLAQTAVELIRAVAATHPVSNPADPQPERWHKWATLRMDFIFGLGAWLLWDELPAETQLLIAQIFEHDADLYRDEPAPALLYDDTQAESNAWTAGGLALAWCMLKEHPRRELWGEKAKEFMISAYATEGDVASARVVDGKPLQQWLRAPNAFPDYSVENHGFIHPIYMAAISEMVRTAVCYQLAGAAIPQAATFNADHVLDALIRLNLPDGNHLYPQGTDYDPRRLDSFLQVCNVIPLKPDPLREAGFLRVLGHMEEMARLRPDMHISGDVAFQYDFGSSWGLGESYLMRRLFGSPDAAVAQRQIESHLVGVHLNEPGKFALQRTAGSVSSFSWHAIDRSTQVMGLTMPLDRDVLCCPQAGSYIGEVTEAHAAPTPGAAPLRVIEHHLQASAAGFAVLSQLERCGSKVLQRCAFLALPDGRSVYLEQRVAAKPVTLTAAESGTVWIYDDLRWPFQVAARRFHLAAGPLLPVAGEQAGAWLNVDDRLGYATLGGGQIRLERCTTGYHTWRLAFAPDVARAAARTFAAAERISDFAVVTSPKQRAADSAALAAELAAGGWQVRADGLLALKVSPYFVYANFTDQAVANPAGRDPACLAAHTATWVE